MNNQNINNQDINNLLTSLSPPKCDNNFSKRINAGKNNFKQDYDKLSSTIIDFNKPVYDKKNDKKNDTFNSINSKMNELRPFENQDIFKQRPIANLSCLNRNYFIEDKKEDINERFQNYEPIPKTHYQNVDRISNYELNKNKFQQRNQRLDNIDNLNTISKKDFNTMIFNTKKHDNNARFQQYAPLPRNVNYSLNKTNPLVVNKLMPSNSRCKYDFKN